MYTYIYWRKKWQPIPVFLPGKFHGQKSLVGYSPWGDKEPDTTEHTHTHIYIDQERKILQLSHNDSYALMILYLKSLLL